MLSYGIVEKPRSKRWRFTSVASCIAVLLAGSYAFSFFREFAVHEYRSLTWSSQASSPDPGSGGPESALGGTLPAFDPAPQDSESGQVITVAPKPGQTIEELSRIYAGRYDSELYQEIYALNPNLKDPENLEAGELIRLPLPPGTLKKVVDTSDPSSQPGRLESAIAKVKELFASAKH
jgi:hypothetical protein